MKRLLSLVMCVALAPPAAQAGFNTPGIIDFDWLAEEGICPTLAELPAESPWTSAAAQAVFGSAASSFGEEGVLIWAAIPLEAPDGWRTGILQIDLDLARVSLGHSLPVSAIRAEYVEKRGDEVLFFGTPAEGEVWLSDLIRSYEEASAVLGHFEFLFDDPDGRYPGCRVFRAGTFVTNPSPEKLRQFTHTPSDQSGDVYVESGCNGNVVIVDDGQSCDCGGEDTSGSDCEGESTSDNSSCEGDSADSGCEGDSAGSGCEGDSGGADCGGSGGGCSGGGGGCEGAARAAATPPRPRGGPIRLLSRFFPEIVVFGFIVWMRRRNKR